MHKFESSQKDESKAQSTDSSKAVISNEGEIAPLGAILPFTRFQFPRGRFLQVRIYQNSDDSKIKNCFSHFRTNSYDALSITCFVKTVRKHKI